MSVLDWPRLNFRGIFRTNPSTSNNDDVMPDMVDRDTNTLGAALAGMDDTQAMAFLREAVCMANYGETGPCTTFMRSGWNLFGDFQTNFDQATVTSFVDENGNYSTDPNVHPLIGTQFKLLGAVGDGTFRRADPMICDLDPTGLVTTQIWTGGAGFYMPNGDYLGGWDHDTRCYQDWLDFMSTVGSYGGEQNFVGIGCMFQFTIPPEVCAKHLVTCVAPDLRVLLGKAAAEEGLAIRFQVLEVEPAITDGELAAIFARGQGVGNPAYGYVVGTLGVHHAGEPETEPAGRKLSPPYPRPAMSYGPPPGQSGDIGTVPPAPEAWEGPPALFGNLVVNIRQSPAVLTVDMVNAFPKWGFRNPNGPPVPYDPNGPPPGFDQPVLRADVGTLTLVCDLLDGSTVTLGELAYGLGDWDDWAARGGLQDIPYDGSLYADICAGNLRIVGTGGLNAGTSVLTEDVLRLVTDDRGVYVSKPGASQIVTLRVFERGGPPTSPVTVYFQEYANIIQTDAIATDCADLNRPNQTTQQRSQITPPPTGANRVLPLIQGLPASSVVLPAGSTWVPVTLLGANAGAAVLNYQLSPYVISPSVPAWSTQIYSSVRVFTDDDYSGVIASGNIPWAFVYENVLRYYYLLFPFMSTMIPLNLSSSILRFGDLITQRLGTPDDAVFFTSQNMPPTHTMSPGKVTLLKAWIAQETAKSASNTKVGKNGKPS